MTNIYRFPTLLSGEPNETPAVFGKRKFPPTSVRHEFGAHKEHVLVVHDRRSAKLGFSGEFRTRSPGLSGIPVYEVGQCPGEVYTKLARRRELAAFRDEILQIEISPLDWAM